VIIGLLIAAFIIGSIPTGSIIAAFRGIDLKKTGSGNIGATNVMRSMGKVAALTTLAGDMLKGMVMILAVRTFLPEAGIQLSNVLPSYFTNTADALECALGIAAILGHNFSIFLKFRGGKGVATSLGVALVLSPYAALLAATIWLMTFRITRYSSLGGIVAFCAFPGCIYITDYSSEKIAAAGIIAVIILLTHRANIQRLIAGTENKFNRVK
jgi:acyl phosphate:glycerol-3-phosphate acyltransferase